MPKGDALNKKEFSDWYFECVPQGHDSPLRARIECVLGKDCMDIHLSQERMQRVRNCIDVTQGKEVRVVHKTCCRSPDCKGTGKHCPEFVSLMLWSVAAWAIAHAGENSETQAEIVSNATGVHVKKVCGIIKTAMRCEPDSVKKVKDMVFRQVINKY